jgi:predicted transcriptional regulator
LKYELLRANKIFCFKKEVICFHEGVRFSCLKRKYFTDFQMQVSE